MPFHLQGPRNWSKLKVKELVPLLEARGLPAGGRKADLVQRLVDNDAAEAAAHAGAAAHVG